MVDNPEFTSTLTVSALLATIVAAGFLVPILWWRQHSSAKAQIESLESELSQLRKAVNSIPSRMLIGENKNYVLSIAEPLSYSGLDGPNEIRGKVVKLLSSTHLIFKSDSELSFGNRKGQLLLLQGQQHDFDLVFPDRIEGAFTGFLLADSYEGKTVYEMMHEGQFCVMGRISASA